MKYAVVIPARNEEKHIHKTLSALRKQTIPPSQIIVVDDGSKDRTGQIASKYAGVVIRLPDRGHSAMRARMQKLEHAHTQRDRQLIGVVVKVRDEQDVIENSLLSLLNQTLKPFIVVVNDGSLDRTGEIASKYADVVVDLPRHEESWVGRPELAMVVNAGLDVLKRKELDFVMFSDGEAVYPLNYIEEIVKRMNNCDITLASGVAEGEVTRSFSPRGSGRVVDARWFREVGFKYPANYGFDAYLVFKALSQGRKVVVFQNLRFRLRRKTRLYAEKAYVWGKGMKALNYDMVYALGRAFLFSLKSPRNGLELLRGYFSDVEKYRDLEEFVPAFQKRQFWRRVREVLHV